MEKKIVINQPVFNKILNNINEKGNISQAYILVGNDENALEDYSILFSKVLICPNNFNIECNNCNICKRISNNSYSELKIIKPINNVIKKEEIINLRNTYQTQAIEGKLLVYIISGIEKLNSAAANSLLKFLEEPDSDVVAIFTTTNLNLVYNTIISRCQIIKLNTKNDEKDYLQKFDNINNDIEYIIDFILDVENNYEKAISSLKDKFLKKFNSKDLIKLVVEIMGLYYKDILNYILFKETVYFSKEKIIKSNLTDKSIDIITSKISFIFDSMSKLDYNVNIILFMTNLLIRIGELNDDKSSRY